MTRTVDLPDMPIIDAHLHVYDPGAIGFAWMSDVPLLDEPHLPGRFEAATEEIEVEAAVFVEVNADRGRHMDEARFVRGLMAEAPVLRAMVASVPLEAGPEEVADDLEALGAIGGVRGIRSLLETHADEPGWALRAPFVDAVRDLASRDLSFDICLRSTQLADAIALVRACPDTRFVLDHIGKPDIRGGRSDPWREQIAELARMPNVWCKISGVVTEADHAGWTHDDVAPYIATAIHRFGYERVMFGGDWPVSRLATSYPLWVQTVARIVRNASPEEKRRLWRDTATEFYRLDEG